MSQPNTSTSNNNRKRSSTTCTSPQPPTTTTTTGGDSGGGGGAHFLAMKKAKSQAVSCSLDNKNGFQQHQFDNNPSAEPSSMIEDPTENDAGRASSAGGFTANLARKKATPPQPAKKLVIKLLKAKPTLPTNFEENTWAVLKSAISAIFLKQPDPCDLEKLYQAVNDLCLYKMGEVFTKGLRGSVKPIYLLL